MSRQHAADGVFGGPRSVHDLDLPVERAMERFGNRIDLGAGFGDR